MQVRKAFFLSQLHTPYRHIHNMVVYMRQESYHSSTSDMELFPHTHYMCDHSLATSRLSMHMCTGQHQWVCV